MKSDFEIGTLYSSKEKLVIFLTRKNKNYKKVHIDQSDFISLIKSIKVSSCYQAKIWGFGESSLIGPPAFIVFSRRNKALMVEMFHCLGDNAVRVMADEFVFEHFIDYVNLLFPNGELEEEF